MLLTVVSCTHKSIRFCPRSKERKPNAKNKRARTFPICADHLYLFDSHRPENGDPDDFDRGDDRHVLTSAGRRVPESSDSLAARQQKPRPSTKRAGAKFFMLECSHVEFLVRF